MLFTDTMEIQTPISPLQIGQVSERDNQSSMDVLSKICPHAVLTGEFYNKNKSK